jgi:hypothetical protein
MTKVKKGWSWGMAQVVQHLPHKHKTLSSNPRTTKRTTTIKNKTKLGLSEAKVV